MAQCLTKSLTSAAKTRLEVFQSQNTFDGVEYGPLIYKKIMQLATINSVATTETLRAKPDKLAHLCGFRQRQHRPNQLLLQRELLPDPGKESHRQQPRLQTIRCLPLRLGLCIQRVHKKEAGRLP